MSEVSEKLAVSRRVRGSLGDFVEVINAATYEAALALLAERALELGLRLTEVPAVPDGQPRFAVYTGGVYRCPHCGTDETDVITGLTRTASVRFSIRQGIFNREHSSRKREAIRAAPLVSEGRRCPGCGIRSYPSRRP